MALTDLDSISLRLKNQDAGGAMERMFHTRLTATTTLANITSGYITAQRMPLTFTIPSLTGYTGWELDVEMLSEDISMVMAALEYDLGVLTVSSNTFAAGTDASMPTKDTRIQLTTYSAEQTASLIPMMVVTSALTATTPVITTTYVNEDGTGSRTSTMTLPTNAGLNSAFCMSPHLNSGDTGVQDVTNMSKSAGTAGELRIKGLLPVAMSNMSEAAGFGGFMKQIMQPLAPFLGVSGENLAFYRFGTQAAGDVDAMIFGRPI